MTPRGSPALADVAGLFGDAGPLARVLPAFEPRPQQARMAQEVASCLASGRHLVIEAGTGIGKSIAYLLPAILNSLRTDLPADERRVVVSTHTRALQEQLARKDLPLLQRVLESEGVTFRYALLMGSDNYLCVQRLHEARLARGGLLNTRGEMSEALARHARSAVSGLRSEIPFVVPDGLWSRVHRDRDICLGVRGPFWEDCLYRRDLARARESDLLIVNHALFFLDLKTGGRILPPHGVVVLDEAHRIEEAVVAQFGLSVSDRSVARFLEDLGSRERGRSRKVRAREAGDAEREVVPDLLPRLREAAATFFDEVRRRTLDLPHAAASASDSAGPARLVRLRQPGLFEDRLRPPPRSADGHGREGTLGRSGNGAGPRVARRASARSEGAPDLPPGAAPCRCRVLGRNRSPPRRGRAARGADRGGADPEAPPVRKRADGRPDLRHARGRRFVLTRSPAAGRGRGRRGRPGVTLRLPGAIAPLRARLDARSRRRAGRVP